MKTVRFGLIGCGLMEREFASAVARWCHLPNMDIKPEIVAVCNTTLQRTEWYTDHFDSIGQVTDDYRRLLANPDVEAVYIAVPHHLHQEIYCAAIEAGKHLMGEKPFGIDKPANDAILEYNGGEQIRGQLDMGHETAFPVITGGIFEFGFSDAILQMWAAFLYKLKHGAPLQKFAGCATPRETALSHRLFTAAVDSHQNARVAGVAS